MLTRRLVEVWVHRRGLESLQGFCASTLAGSEAASWVQEQMVVPWLVPGDGVAAGAGFSPSRAVDRALIDYARAAEGIEEAPAPPALAAVTAEAVPPAGIVPVEEVTDTGTPPGSDPLEDRFELELELEPVSGGDADPVQEGADPHAAADAAPEPAGAIPALAAVAPPAESLLHRAPRLARLLMSRARVLLRECLEEVMDGLSRSPEPLDRPTPVGRPGATVVPFVHPSLASEELSGPDTPAFASPPREPLLPGTPAASARATSSRAVAVERLRPRPRLAVPHLPRASRPAPAPPDLADLRIWLPDPIEDLPRAC